jgi:hypothetical protein
MKAADEQIIQEKGVEDSTVIDGSTKSHNPGLRALLAIKNITGTLDTDYAGLLKIEAELKELFNKALLMMETNTIKPEALSNWKQQLQSVNNEVTGINDALVAAKEKIRLKETDGFAALWTQLAEHLAALKDHAKNAASIGLNLLPTELHTQWENEFVLPETALVESIETHVASCRVLLQMIERYTADELSAISKIVVDKIPLDFTYEEAEKYQKDYYKALVDFKKEFKAEKNLWDKFLDILAGGTHQPPSERIMMERWLDGEKADLD